MSTKSDIEIVVHNKKQLSVLIDKMLKYVPLKFLFIGNTDIENQSGINNLPEWLDNYKEYKEHCTVSLAYYDEGYILCLNVKKKLRPKVKEFLESIKIFEKREDVPTIIKDENGDKVDLYIKSLDKKTADQIKNLLIELGVINMNERPYYEQDPVY